VLSVAHCMLASAKLVSSTNFLIERLTMPSKFIGKSFFLFSDRDAESFCGGMERTRDVTRRVIVRLTTPSKFVSSGNLFCLFSYCDSESFCGGMERTRDVTRRVIVRLTTPSKFISSELCGMMRDGDVICRVLWFLTYL